MPLDEPLLGALGFLTAVVVVLVDGRRAVAYAALAAAAGLLPAAAGAGGAESAAVLGGGGALAALLAVACPFIARRATRVAGVDPAVPVVARGEALFGPRSVRAATAVAVLPAASWVAFNAPVGTATTVSGALFPIALVWGCGGVRLLTARTLNDVAVAVTIVGLASAAAWFVAAGVETLAGAAAAASLAPAAAAVAGWLSGRHAPARRAAAAT